MRKSNGYWTKEKCTEEALKYDTKRDFKKFSHGAYGSSKKLKCYDEICAHMKPIGNLYNRCIYSYEFEDNSVYIGLTYNLIERNIKHMRSKKSSVYKHMKDTNIIPKLIKLTDYINVNVAQIKEGEYVEKYRNDGWNILNKSKTGTIGSNKKIWTFEKCKIEALKYNKRIEFCKKSSGSYRSAQRLGFLDEICQHMNNLNKWTFENCKKEAIKYNLRFDFCKGCKSAYTSALNNNWLNEICIHMDEYKNYLLSYDYCKLQSLKYKTKTEFYKKSNREYGLSRTNKWLNDFYK